MISVLMSVYNEPEKYLRKSIESILNQSILDFEYIIILDNPMNELAKSIIEEYALKDERVTIHINEKNIGLTASLNKAFCYSSGEYIARIDADDFAEKDRLEKQLDYIESNQLDFIGCSMRRISENDEVVYQQTNSFSTPECISKMLKYDNCVPHPSWFVKRKVYEDLGGYRDIDACEDYDFLLRSRDKGYKIGLCGELLMNYRVNTSGISRTNSLKQALTSEYLQKNILHINDITKTEVDNYVVKRNTIREAEKYELAFQKMNSIIEEAKGGKKILILSLPFLLISSKYIHLNLKKIVLMRLVKIKYKR